MRNLGSFEKIHIDYENNIEPRTSDFVKPLENGIKEVEDDGNNNNLGTEIPLEKVIVNGGERKYVVSSERKTNDTHMIISPAKAVENKIMNTNKNYFGSYSSFGIHREMISDKVPISVLYFLQNRLSCGKLSILFVNADMLCICIDTYIPMFLYNAGKN